MTSSGMTGFLEWTVAHSKREGHHPVGWGPGDWKWESELSSSIHTPAPLCVSYFVAATRKGSLRASSESSI